MQLGNETDGNETRLAFVDCLWLVQHLQASLIDAPLDITAAEAAHAGADRYAGLFKRQVEFTAFEAFDSQSIPGAEDVHRIGHWLPLDPVGRKLVGPDRIGCAVGRWLMRDVMSFLTCTIVTIQDIARPPSYNARSGFFPTGSHPVQLVAPRASRDLFNQSVGASAKSTPIGVTYEPPSKVLRSPPAYFGSPARLIPSMTPNVGFGPQMEGSD